MYPLKNHFRGRGYARLIVESIYSHALRNGQYVRPEQIRRARQKLKPIFDRLDQQHPQAASPYMRTGESQAEWELRMSRIRSAN